MVKNDQYFGKDFGKDFDKDMICEKCGQQIKKHKSRPLESYYWSHIVPLVCKEQGMTTAEAHRFLLAECAERDRFGRPITTSDAEFTVTMQLGYVESVRNMLARELQIITEDPNPEWRATA